MNFYYTGPPTKLQKDEGITIVKTTGPLATIQCSEKDAESNQQCTKRTVIGCDICTQHLKQNKNLQIKKSTIFADGKSIGKGLFAINTGDRNEIIFHNGVVIIDYVGEIIDEDEREKRYGNGTGPYCLGGKLVDDDIDSPFVDSAFVRGAASIINHMPLEQSNAQYQFDTVRNMHVIVAIKDIYSGEEIFCDYGDEYQLFGEYSGKHATISNKKSPPKWYI